MPMNPVSSRSHAIIELQVTTATLEIYSMHDGLEGSNWVQVERQATADEDTTCFSSSLFFADLMGSEALSADSLSATVNVNTVNWALNDDCK